MEPNPPDLRDSSSLFVTSSEPLRRQKWQSDLRKQLFLSERQRGKSHRLERSANPPLLTLASGIDSPSGPFRSFGFSYRTLIVPGRVKPTQRGSYGEKTPHFPPPRSQAPSRPPQLRSAPAISSRSWTFSEKRTFHLSISRSRRRCFQLPDE